MFTNFFFQVAAFKDGLNVIMVSVFTRTFVVITTMIAEMDQMKDAVSEMRTHQCAGMLSSVPSHCLVKMHSTAIYFA